MIPKKIHYIWFGKGEKNDRIKHCIESWEKYLPDYEIIEWNEDNFDVNYNTFIPEGGLFYRSAVTTWDNMPDSAWADIEEGNTIISLNVGNDTTYGNSIYPGDHIDLYYSNVERKTGANATSKPFIGPLIKGIKLLAVKDKDGKHIFKKGPDQKEAQELIFSVNDSNFLFLKRAMSISGGKIIPVLRNQKYAQGAEQEKGSEYIEMFIKVNSYMSKDDENLIKNSTKNTTKNNDTGTTNEGTTKVVE